MQKLKKVVHGHRKSTDAAQEGAKSAVNPSCGASGASGASGDFSGPEDHHPIYDQFTGQTQPSTVTEPDHSKLNPPDSAKSFDSLQDSPHPDHAHSRPFNISEAASTASIKSGVMGFPQGNDDPHAAFQRHSRVRSNPEGAQFLSGPTSSHTNEVGSLSGKSPAGAAGAAGAAGTYGSATHDFSRQGEKDATGNPIGLQVPRTSNPSIRPESEPADWGKTTVLAVGVAGAGGYAAHELNPPRENVVPKSTAEQQPFERFFGQTQDIQETGRAFPLTGGVVPIQKTSNAPATNEKKPGIYESQEYAGREGLAGAAAAAAASSTVPLEKRAGLKSQEMHPEYSNDQIALAGATSSTVPPEQKDFESQDTRPQDGHNQDALAAATTAVGISSARSQPEPAEPLSGSFTSANKRPAVERIRSEDIHIPGEFPDPTPADEPAEPLYSHGIDSTVGTTAPHELRHTGTLDHPQTRTDGASHEHHHGRDAAIAGGIGAAGLVSYATQTPHHGEPSVAQENFPAEANPYSSTKLDPRVDGTHAHSEKIEPTPVAHPGPFPLESGKHHSTDAALAGEALGSSALASGTKESAQPLTAQSGSTTTQIQDTNAQNHYGRNAALQSNIANTVDSPTQPQYEGQEQVTMGVPQSNTLHHNEPNVEHEAQPQGQHHYGRDAAVAGGVGAVGYGAYKAAEEYTGHRSTQPSAPMDEQRYNPDVSGARYPAVASANQTYDLNEQAQHGFDQKAATGVGPQDRQYDAKQGVQDANQNPQHHHGRDAAVVGGLGAAGAGAYAVARGDRDDSQRSTPQNSLPAASSHQRYDSVQVLSNQYQKHDAAALGVTGIVGAGGAYGYSQHEAEQERRATQKAEELELEHARKEQQKEVYRQQEADRGGESDEGKGKKHRLFGFLHRDKDRESASTEASPRKSKEHSESPHSRELTPGGNDGGQSYGSEHGSDGKKKHNKLHKDPPKGHPAREAMEKQQHPGTEEHAISRDAEPQYGNSGAYPGYNVASGGNGYRGVDSNNPAQGY